MLHRIEKRYPRRIPFGNKECFFGKSLQLSGWKACYDNLPYPPVRVEGKNRMYAPICSVWTIAWSVSELSAIAQYINNENRISGENRAAAKVILSIAMAEMMHLQKLGN